MQLYFFVSANKKNLNSQKIIPLDKPFKNWIEVCEAAKSLMNSTLKIHYKAVAVGKAIHFPKVAHYVELQC